MTDYQKEIQNLINQYNELIPVYLKSKNKLDLLFDFEKLFFSMIQIYTKIKHDFEFREKLSFDPDKDTLFLEFDNKIKKIKNILIELREQNYKEWIKSDNKKVIYKSATGFNRNLKCYERNFRFTLFSLNDPITDDEKLYLQNFFNSVYETNHIDLNTISKENLTFALNNLLTN